MGFLTSHQPRFHAAPNFLKMGINYLNLSPLSVAKLQEGVGHLEARFQGKGSSPCQYIDTTPKAIECSTTLPLTVSI